MKNFRSSARINPPRCPVFERARPQRAIHWHAGQVVRDQDLDLMIPTPKPLELRPSWIGQGATHSRTL